MRFQEKIERIEHRHFRNQIHFHQEFSSRIGEHHAGEIVRLRILLPVQKMFLRLDF